MGVTSPVRAVCRIADFSSPKARRIILFAAIICPMPIVIARFGTSLSVGKKREFASMVDVERSTT